MDTKKSKGVVDRKIENKTTHRKDVSKQDEKKEKKMSTAQKALPVMIVISVALAVILLATLIAFFQLKETESQNSRNLEAVYASSYFSMVDAINNLQVDCSKFETLKNEDAQRQSLKDMEQDCGYILSGLAILPIEAENCMSATKFFNQIDGMCEAFINKLDKNQTLTTEDVSLVGQTGFVLGLIKNKFNEQNQMISKVGYSFIDASVFNSKGVNEFSTTLGSVKSSEIDYPVMIFDGPFSASLETKVIKGLSEKEISKDDAIKYIQDKVFANSKKLDVKYMGETNGDFTTYNFDCLVDGEKYSVQITKRDGLLLSLSGYADRKEPVLSKNESIKLAEKFADNLGFEKLKCVWFEKIENIAYVNLAPIVNDIILYPDLVKVKIDLTGERVIGFESQNYCLNHVTRYAKANINESDAKSLIVGDYNIQTIEMAIIPIDDGSEMLTYEIKCEGIDGTYYFYIDAANKEIAKILKVVEQNGVDKLI